jgi:signal transduction histidine kinase
MPDPQRLILGSTLRQHIGGRWAISYISVLAAAPIGIAASGTNIASINGSYSFAVWLTLGIVGIAAITMVLAIANFTLFRTRRQSPVPIWWVVVLGMIAGAARSAVVVPLSSELGAITFSWSELLIRVFSGAAIGALMLPIGALLCSVVSSYIHQRRQLLSELSSLEVERMRLTGESEALRRSVLAELRSEVGEVVESGDPDLARSVSHRIWERTDLARAPRVTWPDVLWAAVAHNPYPIVPVAGFWAVSALGTTVVLAGWLAALGQITFSVACIAALFLLGRWASGQWPGASIPILVVVLIALEMTVAWAAPLLFQRDPVVDNGAAMVANAIWIPFLVLMVGAVVSAIRSGDEVVARLRERVADDQAKAAALEFETARIRKDVAAALHGSVQSQLLAAAAGLSQPHIAQLMTRTTGDGLQEALASVEQAITNPMELDERMKRIRRSWGSLVQLTMTGLEVPQTANERHAVSQVVEEAIANSYRHGGASEVGVTVTRDSTGLRIRVIDNGSGLRDDARPGLGSAVLESLAPGAWSLTRADNHTTVLDVLLRDSQA